MLCAGRHNNGNQFALVPAEPKSMYSQANLSEVIERSIPALHKPLHTPECEKSIYKQVKVLSHYLADHIEDKKLTEVSRTLHLANRLYESGSMMVQGAIKNVFVYSFSMLLIRAGEKRKTLLSVMPLTLFSLYMNQVLNCGC